jgi:hypothetical protein
MTILPGVQKWFELQGFYEAAMENAIVFGANDESADYADFTDLKKTESQNCTRSTKEILIKNTCL